MSDSYRPGEIWWVDLDPGRGSEADKVRPAVIVGSDSFHGLPVRLIVPCSSWRPRFASHRNKVLIRATAENGLPSDSAADGLQIRLASLDRFDERIGTLSTEEFE